jgi:hypothetical protein
MLLLEVESQNNKCSKRENHKRTTNWEKEEFLKKTMVKTIQ